jgi:hypothetical protein
MDSLLNLKNQGLGYGAEDAFDKITAAITGLENELAQLRAQVAAMPKPLTLAEISKGLSANGAAPLNLTGLPGK